MRATALIFATFVLIGSRVLLAADPVPATPPATSPPATSPPAPKPGNATAQSDARAEFQRALKDFQKMVATLTSVGAQYSQAAEKDKPALSEKYMLLLKDVDPKSEQLATAAEKVLNESPGDQTMASLLTAIAMTRLRSDQYEDANRLAQLLAKNGFKTREVNVILGRSSHALGNLTAAQAALEEADKQRRLDTDSRTMLNGIPALGAKLAREQKFRDTDARAGNLPRVKITTTQGDIVVELFEDQAPNTVANFISLVEKKFYNGTPFHRVLAGFMAQTGDPTGTGKGGPGYHIAAECLTPNHREHFRGSLAMARNGTDLDSAGSQFYMTFTPQASLDGQYTVFGRVLEGMNVLTKIQRMDPDHPTAGISPDKIISMTVLRKRDHPYSPLTLP